MEIFSRKTDDDQEINAKDTGRRGRLMSSQCLNIQRCCMPDLHFQECQSYAKLFVAKYASWNWELRGLHLFLDTCLMEQAEHMCSSILNSLTKQKH